MEVGVAVAVGDRNGGVSVSVSGRGSGSGSGNGGGSSNRGGRSDGGGSSNNDVISSGDDRANGVGKEAMIMKKSRRGNTNGKKEKGEGDKDDEEGICCKGFMNLVIAYSAEDGDKNG